ncbi:MAG: rhodanese-like domain-containing protein [Pyrinomonadaceae bacterium]
MLKFVLISIGTLVVFAGGCNTAPAVKTDSGITETTPQIVEMSPAEAQPLVAKAYSQFIDVRTAEEYAGGHALRAVNIPLDTLNDNLDRLEKNEPVYLICQTDNRSKKAAEVLKDKGFGNIVNIQGGTSAWQTAGLPMETKPPHSGPAK